MRSPVSLSEIEREALWAEVRAEFPDDQMMQEIHFARLLHAAETKDFSPEEQVAYINHHMPQMPMSRSS